MSRGFNISNLRINGKQEGLRRLFYSTFEVPGPIIGGESHADTVL